MPNTIIGSALAQLQSHHLALDRKVTAIKRRLKYSPSDEATQQLLKDAAETVRIRNDINSIILKLRKVYPHENQA